MNKTSRMAAIAIALLMANTQVAAQKVYKCKGPNGVTVYQQVQCADADGERVKIHAQPSQATVAEAQARLNAQSAAEARRQYEQSMRASAPVVEYYEPAPVTHQPPPSMVSTQPALNPSSFDPQRVGFSSSRGYEPLRHRSPNANTNLTRTGPGYTEPSRVQDQYGNSYMRPPGSHFVIDQKTGRQCLAVGGTIRCD